MKKRIIKQVQCVCEGILEGEVWMDIKATVYGRWTSYIIWNRTKKPLAIALSERGGGWGGDTMGAM
jgi:hypothetical protein